MPVTPAVLFLSAAGSLVLGLLVMINNPRRNRNRQFCFFSLVVATWSLLVGGTMVSTHAGLSEWLVRGASYASTQIFATFFLLCLSIEQPQARTRLLLREAWSFLLVSQVIGLLCFTPYYLSSVDLPTVPGTALTVHYGPFFPLFNLYFPFAFCWMMWRFFRALRQAEGIKRSEFQFVLLGMTVSVALGMTTNVLIPQLTGSAATQTLGPLSAVVMNVIVAYGIATKRILDVGYVLRRATAYVFLCAYLAAFYLIVWYAASHVFPPTSYAFPISHLVAAVLVAIAMAPAQGQAQRIANRLFIHLHALDTENTLQEANRMFQSVARLDDLVAQSVKLISRTLGTDDVLLFLRGPDTFTQVFPPRADRQIPLTNPIAAHLQRTAEPLLLDRLQRIRSSAERNELIRHLQQLQVVMAAAIRHKEKLQGIVLLGRRLTGRIYGTAEQDLLQLLGNQLGVAIENAKLYTEVQDARIYNNSLLDHLVNGVVATDQTGRITVFNREAARILHRQPGGTVGQPITCLPRPLYQALATTLETHQTLRDQEFTLHIEQQPVVLRTGATTFHDHEGKVVGAQLVFSDMTRIKALEQQVRHSDRLASIGTLSAGMAHEIKNPLVTIKTFTDLLPTNYEDGEFRERFASLVGSEVKRIDRIVNQLLRFARPAKANLQALGLHEVVQHSLNVIAEDLRKRNVQLQTQWGAVRDTIRGDPDLLQQVLVNFYMNALDAMPSGGTLTVQTNRIQDTAQLPRDLTLPTAREVIHLQVEDTGEGIAEEDLPHIFDPFFTTKSKGVGLGLAVAHRIVAEHNATVKAERCPTGGTVFHLVFPLLIMDGAT